MNKQNAIVFPKEYLPGTTDNFASNEIIVKGINSKQVWSQLVDTSYWPTYYNNAKDISFKDGKGPILNEQSRFKFFTFGFPIEAEITEFEAPTDLSKIGRLAWHGWNEGDSETRMDVIHAWLIEDLSDNRCRILTQESQKGKSAIKLATSLPNPMINGHQEWIQGLADSVKKSIENIKNPSQ